MYPLEVSKVMAALGGSGVVGSTPHTLVELAAAVAKGLPGAVVSQLAANAAPNEVEARRRVAALVTSTASLKRRARLSPAASERAERLARIVALARQALGDEDEAREWLNAPTSFAPGFLGAADRGGGDRFGGSAGRAHPAQY